jgi:hypothetical protein
MTQSADNTIRRRADGSIDTSHYVGRGHYLRGESLRDFLGAAPQDARHRRTSDSFTLI